jgi:D-alanyl-D-alanine dipeptidase
LVAAAADSRLDLIDLQKFDYSIKLDIRYATVHNFTQHAVYSERRCFLRRPVAVALSRVQQALQLQGLGLKVYDCYRPLSVQRTFWQLVPDERYVADPAKGSRHNRGAAVDLTLIDRYGDELEMPSGFDDFTEAAHRDSGKSSKKAKENLKVLEKAMAAEGFDPFPTEWWHYDFHDWESFPVEDVSFAELDVRNRRTARPRGK